MEIERAWNEIESMNTGDRLICKGIEFSILKEPFKGGGISLVKRINEETIGIHDLIKKGNSVGIGRYDEIPKYSGNALELIYQICDVTILGINVFE